MPDGSRKQSDVLCPFYKDDNAKTRSISCEGVFHRTLIVSKFRRQEDRLQQMRLFCADCYKNCEIFRAVMEAKYPDD